jgi:hypothetical protein
LITESDSWRILITFSGTLIYTILAAKGIETVFFMAGILIILVIKNFRGLRVRPKYRSLIKIRFG